MSGVASVSKARKWILLFSMIGLIAVLASFFVGRWIAESASAVQWLNFAIAVLALVSGIALAVADALRGIDRKSQDARERWASWLKIVGHGALIASIAYLVALNLNLALAA